MERTLFSVVGKQIVHSNSKNTDYCMVHISIPFDDAAITSGASGSRVFSTVVTPQEYNSISVADYSGYIMQNGRYSSVVFEEKL